MQTGDHRGATASRSGFPAPPPFALEVRPSRDRVIVTPSGELDCGTVARLDAAVDDLVAAGWDSVVLDLRGLSFMDSTGLRSIVRQGNRTDASVKVIDGAPAVARLFDLTGLRPFLSFISPRELCV